MNENMTKLTQHADNYFSEINLTRKAIVRDDTCLFRAVSEKLFFTQFYHDRVKITCLQYMERHAEEYQPFISENIKDIIKQLNNSERSAGHFEMIVMSRIYRMDFFIFHPTSLEQFNVTQNNFKNKIYLCYSGEGHYDLVYSTNFQESAAVCQSLLYELLYHSVLGLKNESEDAVVFLHVKKFRECSISDVVSSLGKDKLPVLERLSGRTFPPLPYRVAKALHPCIYRNVEFDIIQEEIRDARSVKRAYFADFSIGDKCQVFLEDDDTKAYHGHLQELNFDEGICVVYIEELTVKKTLPARCIVPLSVKIGNRGNTSEWPVTKIDLFRFQKRGRRRKTPPTPLLVGNTTSLASQNTNQDYAHPLSQELPQTTVAAPSSYPLSPSPSLSFTVSHQQISHQQQLLLPATPPSPLCSHAAEVNRTEYFPLFNNREFSDCSQFFYNDFYCCSDQQVYFEGGNISSSPLIFPAPLLPNITEQQSVTDSLDGSCNSNGYTSQGPVVVPNCYQPYIEDNSETVFIGMSSQVPSAQGPMFMMPMMAVPYAPGMGQVNMAWAPSQDPYGKDMPLSGVEYYHMPTHNQQVGAGNYNSPPGAMYAPPTVSEVLPHNAVMTTTTDVNGNLHSMPVPVFSTPGHNQPPQTAVSFVPVDGGLHGQGYSGEKSSKSGNSGKFKVKAASGNGSGKDDKQKSSTDNFQGGDKQCIVSDKSKESVCKEGEEDKEGKDSKTVKDTSEHMDVGSDGDSGCSSECTDLSPVIVPDNEFVDSTSATDDTSSSVELSKPRGKRRYYMYGEHKLIKPIKEIPLRFQMLLSETRAAKARCEGQPIYMQQPAAQQPFDIVYYQTPEESQHLHQAQIQQQPLNANANCFVPGQGNEQGVTFMGEDYSMCSVPGYSNSGPSLQPAPLFVPPPPMPNSNPSNSSQSCPTIIVYSNASSSSSYPPQTSMVYAQASQPAQHVQSIPMPPPPFLPPPSIPPPPVEPSNPAVYPNLATRPKPASSNFASPITSSEIDKKKPAKPVSLNLPTQYSTQANMKITHHSPVSIQTNPNTLLPFLTNAYSKPPNLHTNLQTSMAIDNSTPQTFAPPPSVGNPQAHLQVPPAPCATNVCMSQQPGRGASNQYMYVYPSTPTGVPPSNPPQGAVMYMVSPSAAYSTPNYPSPNFQQQGLMMPSVAAQ